MITPVTRSAWVELATTLLGQDLYDWLRERRQPAGQFTPVSSWRLLSQELASLTDRKVDVSYTALRLFYRDAGGDDAEPAEPIEAAS
jgi:hypothetical protein